MRFPSLDYVWAEARSALLRFPMVIVAGVASAVTALVVVEQQGQGEFAVRLLVACALGISGFAAVELTADRRGMDRWRTFPGYAAVVLFLVFYVWASAHWPDSTLGRRTVQFAVGLHLLVAFLPFAGLGELNGFWQYNRHLFLRFLRSVLFSAVLFLGLVVALLAVDKLLGVRVDDESYLRLLLVIGFVFNTWYFVAGIPSSLSELEQVRDYPVGLRIFSQYILVPLVIVYLVILLLYLGRVVITQEWPRGWIGYLVTSVSVVGILAQLLVYPLQGRPDSRWVGTFSRVFYIALFPPLVMLFLAIWTRIAQYGVTENRYFLVVLALWLTGISLYFTFSRTRNAKVIPTSLAVVAFVTTFGPWGAYTVSRQSQTGRLRDLLHEHAFLDEGRVPSGLGDRARELPFAERKQLSSIMDYLIDAHGLETLQPLFETELTELGLPEATDEDARRDSPVRASRVLESMGVTYVGSREVVQGQDFVYVAHSTNESVSIEGFDLMLVFFAGPAAATHVGEYDLVCSESGTFDVRKGDATLVAADLSEAVAALEGQGSQVTRAQLTVLKEAPELRARFEFDRITGERHDDGSIDLTTASGRVFLAFRPPSSTPASDPSTPTPTSP